MVDRKGARGRRSRRAEKRSVLIVTNGALTERTYLQEMKRRALAAPRARQENLAIKVFFANGEPDSVIRKLSSPQGDTRDYDEVWLVVDEDGMNREYFLQECGRKSTKKQTWTGVVSRPCFEVWLVAHYQQVRRYNNQRDAQRHFRQLVPTELGGKELPEDFPYGAVADAVARSHLPGERLPGAGKLPPSPGTAMPNLMARLGLV